MKVCTKCKVEKELIEFGKHKLGKNGIHPSCKECVRIYNKNFKLNNLEYIKEYDKKYREKNLFFIKQNQKIYYKINKEKLKEYSKNYQKQRKKIDPLYKFNYLIRSNISKCFKRGKNQFHKDAKTEIILGCKIEEFIAYIQSRFIKGMTLENHGKWHLDHIIPISSANTKEEIIKLCHYTNYQPLWAEENWSKSKKIINKQLKLI
jgi:hypothetical protein